MRTRRLLKFVAAAMVLLFLISWGISGALEYGWARRSLLARLSASFGRPVDAGRFSFSLLSGPRLEVNSLTVAEDPRFGEEYFLRAEQLTVGLRWMDLLRGRVEFGAISITQPSLNLVHMPNGHWNVESWLPPSSEPSTASVKPAGAMQGPQLNGHPMSAPAVRHLGRIEIDGGRINFKLNQKKLLFALENVSGELDQDSAGRWSLDLQAVPMLASLTLQQVGTLRLRGTVAGTSARLRPAALDLTWEDASLADALRLASGQDYSVRGLLGAEVSATIKDNPDNASIAGEWNIAGTLRLSGIHRWDLAARAENPGVNVSVAADWSPGTPRLGVNRILIQSAHSQLLAVGDVDWSHGFTPSAQITSSSISLDDLLSWQRSFRPGSREDVTIDGFVGLQGALIAWPPRISQASVGSAGADVHLPQLAAPIHVGPVSVTLRKDSFALDPVIVTLPGSAEVLARARPSGSTQERTAPVGTLRVSGDWGPIHSANNSPATNPLSWRYRLAVSGQTARTQDLKLLAEALGHALNMGGTDWTVQGPAAVQLTWTGTARDTKTPPTGTLDLDGLQLTTALLNQPVQLSSASIELRPGARHAKLGDVQAFGTHWKGTLDQRTTDGVWHFDLAADHLDITDLDRWLGPRARPSFLQRMFASSGTPPTRDVEYRGITTVGRLRIGELALSPLRAQKLDTSVEFDGRRFLLKQAHAQFFDGIVSGDFEAQISSSPAYSFHGGFERINLAALASATSSLNSRFAGIASGNLVLSAHGIGRAQLVASLAGTGRLQVRDAILRGVDLLSSPASTGELKYGSETRLTGAIGVFHLESGAVHVDTLSLSTREEHFELQGSAGLNRVLDLRIWPQPRQGIGFTDSATPATRDGWTVGGTLDTPQFIHHPHMDVNPERVTGREADVLSNPASSIAANPALSSSPSRR